MNRFVLLLLSLLGTGALIGPTNSDAKNNSDQFKNLFMEEEGVSAISDWNAYRSEKYKKIGEYLARHEIGYVWLDSNPIAFGGIPFVVFRAMESYSRERPDDPMSTKSLRSAGLGGWLGQDRQLIREYYGGNAVNLFRFSEKFGFPVGLGETRILPGAPVEESSDLPNEAKLENQDGELRIPWDESLFSTSSGLDHLSGATIEMFETDDNGEQRYIGRVPMNNFRSTSLRGVTFACGACHIGRVRMNRDEASAYLPLVGAPNTQFDTHDIGRAFGSILADSKFSADKIRALIGDKKPEWFYDLDDASNTNELDLELKLRLAQTQMELDFLLRPMEPSEIGGFAVRAVTGKDARTLSEAQRKAILLSEDQGPAIRAVMDSLAGKTWLDAIMVNITGSLKAKGETNARILASTYAHDRNGFLTPQESEDYLSAPTPGRVDTLASPFAAFAIEKGKEQNQWEPYMQRVIAKNDYPSIWRQDRRAISNWDGTVGAFYRNIGSGLSLGQHPDKVDFRNGLFQKEFLEELPSPAYPFDVDLGLASKGKAIYAEYCESCHNVEVTEKDRDTNLERLATDPNRARSIPSPMAKFLAEKILAACKEPSMVECRPNSDGNTQHVVLDAEAGYKSDTLGGIWARAPYLHNGSVPTMRHLLQPSTRPESFCRGSLDYDMTNMGFGWTMNVGEGCQGEDRQVIYQTGLPSQMNTGHAGEIYLGVVGDMSDSHADALIEYMKTF